MEMRTYNEAKMKEEGHEEFMIMRYIIKDLGLLI